MRSAIQLRTLGRTCCLTLLVVLAAAGSARAQTRSYRPVSPAESRQSEAEESGTVSRPPVMNTSARTYKSPQYTAPSQVSSGKTIPLEQVRQQQQRSNRPARAPEPRPMSPRTASREAAPAREMTPVEQVRAAERRLAAQRSTELVYHDEDVRPANYRSRQSSAYRDTNVRRAQFEEGPMMADDFAYQEGFENGPRGDFQGMRGPADGWHRYPTGPCEPYGVCESGCGSCNSCWGLFDDFSVFAGTHGYKSPLDFGNGNFGFQEGFNWGGPLWQSFGLGYQFGFQALQSNLSGDNTTGQNNGNDRNQYFMTFGLVRRVRDCRPHELGFQWGVVADWRHDEYYTTADLFQLRAQLSVFFTPCDEFGFELAANSDREEVFVPIGSTTSNLIWDVTDQYRFFYRRQFDCRGEARIWGGFTENSDGIVGADFRVALASKWALEGGWNYIIPKQGASTGGNEQESWNLAMNVVWYPAKTALRSSTSKWRPLFPVADNGSFVVEFK
ncbi:MAG: hypothetical protein KF708_07555 [Pirellulales bacterium]|nr:hypothetical protein [Pirellulales bacterium]